MTMVLRLVVFALIGAVGCGPRPQADWLGPPDRLAPGVDFYRNTDTTLVASRGAIAVFLVRVDPERARVASVLSNGRVLDAESVADIARRHNAVVAINGGFFNRANGEPTGLLKVDGELVSDSSLTRGVVIIDSPPGGPVRLDFDRLAAKMALTYDTGDGAVTVAIDGVDTTRERGKLMMYTPDYHPHSDTAPTGTEWVLDGDPLRVQMVRAGVGRTPIPSTGVVLSYGGTRLPPDLLTLTVGVEVSLSTTWRSSFGVPDATLDRSHHIISGAGLLRRGGAVVTTWKEEGLLDEDFTHSRHPRTIIGRDRTGTIWLGAVDGRQPDHSIGMTFEDLQRLGDRLGLTDALNLDGGGSTTMVIRGQVVNRPSDPGGGRPVADAIVVTPR
jgi:hypothetical protein